MVEKEQDTAVKNQIKSKIAREVKRDCQVLSRIVAAFFGFCARS